jgi:hypothetical protein
MASATDRIAASSAAVVVVFAMLTPSKATRQTAIVMSRDWMRL